ncbi:MAG: hypothetical protein A3A94_02465 [Candidatus Portnoybacteria bacterium RIFCSPLOWO2_01_FULL_43_11]|uniref:Uncharacterized protein n=4 Tax=Candidatus Portnoyibacteriota TaxID=1817913 RepID=A0A1G2FB63_9BACT|nr:MAG: hypothetical protein A2815_02380 [Candidatus Portnoybacteria bacterium RIFCSPHIGHO2_01_FULL_40_12b]OGZ38872.1 MAG: hypothetical protein A3A94_02465 [Candidatus Portnoybacteria bacterium RIFCSPLOWO2_01_FULL_43_11]OGZ39459.1 MAG: hypothetical protein A3E90_01695 [Candidatus Portnoybacteria bacterium RIFCSPHIGHO2_12_FULL_40_11]OGZ40514.1 MAG: hypothetical protein A3I20_00495 [Candidatus Portnoybacteria bacterium RIFCSPLOWO2_02_FULL_40_15]
MIKIPPFNFKKIYIFLRTYERWILGAIFLLLLCFNVLIVYQYIYLAVNKQPELKTDKMEINQEILGKILDDIEEREETLSRVLKKQYSDPFK